MLRVVPYLVKTIVPLTIIRAGGFDGAKDVRIPPAFSKLIRMPSDLTFDTEPDPGVQERSIYWPRGKMVGGSASINAMMSVRGYASDYDALAQVGNPGWSYADVLPYFRNSKRFAGGANEFHGADRPWHVVEQAWPRLDQRLCRGGPIARLPPQRRYYGTVKDGVGSEFFCAANVASG